MQHIEVRGTKLSLRHLGLSLTCASQERVIELVDGARNVKLSSAEMDEADRNGWKEKEKYLNAGLSAAYDGARQKPHVEVEFVHDKEHVLPWGGKICNVCDEKMPFADEYCKLKFSVTWHMKWSNP